MTFALALLGARKFIAAHWQWFAAVAVALLLWHLVAVHDRAQWNAGYNADWSQQHQALLDEQQSHAVTRTSLNQALVKIADQNDAVGKMKAAADARTGAAATAQKAAEDAAKPREAAAKALDASAAKADTKSALCTPSEAFLAHSGEL